MAPRLSLLKCSAASPVVARNNKNKIEWTKATKGLSKGYQSHQKCQFSPALAELAAAFAKGRRREPAAETGNMKQQGELSPLWATGRLPSSSLEGLGCGDTLLSPYEHSDLLSGFPCKIRERSIEKFELFLVGFANDF